MANVVEVWPARVHLEQYRRFTRDNGICGKTVRWMAFPSHVPAVMPSSAVTTPSPMPSRSSSGLCPSQGFANPTYTNALALTLLTTMARSGSSKALIIPSSEPGLSKAAEARRLALHTWVLNGNISYTSTGAASRDVPAVKLLYRVIDQAEADRMLESFADGVPDIMLPESEITVILAGLARSNTFLPPAERLFKDWTVALLTKWQDATGPSVI